MKTIELVDHLRGVELKPVETFWKIDSILTLKVVLDGHHPETGQRIHVVSGFFMTQIINNALVIGVPEYNKVKGLLYGQK